MIPDDTSPVPAHLLRARRSKIVLDASEISPSSDDSGQHLPEREGENGKNSKTGPLSSPSGPSPDAATVPQRVPAPAKIPKSKDEPKRTGRKPDPDSTLPRVFDSMEQCAARTGVPVSVLKLAKKGGCPAFNHSRVDLISFLKWRFGLPEDAVEDWGNDWKMWKAKREKIAHDKDAGTVADRSAVTQAHGKATSALFSLLDRYCGNSLPPTLKGLSETEIQAVLMDMREKLKQAWRAALTDLKNEPTPPAEENVNKPNLKK